MTAAPYDAIAGEYYDRSHKTSRNFDHAAAAALESVRERVPAGGLILDVGAGRGRCIEFLGVKSRRVVQLDNSARMLSLEAREECLIRVLHDAQNLPFLDASFACVTAFLGDAFWGLNFLTEAWRVLRPGGLFLATLPTFEWGKAIREQLKLDRSLTRFVTQSGSTVIVPSSLVPVDRLPPMLRRAGFAHPEITSHRLAQEEQPISPDIADAAQRLGMPPDQLHVINLIVAQK